MHRCDDCVWFVPRSEHSARGTCLPNEEQRMRTDKRCNDKFEKRERV